MEVTKIENIPTALKSVTSLDQMKRASMGELVELSPFHDGTPLVVRLRRPSISALISHGQIPNELLAILAGVNEKKSNAPEAPVSDAQSMKDNIALQSVFCKSCLVEPSWSDLEAHGIALTDSQISEIALYAQGGIESLKSFRELTGHNSGIGNRPDVQLPAE